ncbi:hypothetical protein LTR84_004377 [Exophiala bonariae]|uniref:FAD-binding PCMH-type domain-containing protein n=1 Tax=Exophiala bonariae TaxID=1690606 RepID=A0AAV9N5Q7_9EURO|nr:hypothetical protein LTR84_004377 [Exophiala bonariae]
MITLVSTSEDIGGRLSTAVTDDVTSALLTDFPQQVFTQRDPKYKSLQESYFSGNQRALKPRCFFQPRSAQDLARAVTLCVKAHCPFGLKSGGHGHYAGQSCLDGGIQLDLALLNTISLDRNKGTVHVGPGATWNSVYTRLQKERLIAVGGRSAGVGVGGFLVGGGLSFYAARRGWAINHVRSFQVVLSNGSIVTASRENEPTLFRALRGGGSNLGVIASFELETYPYSGMWGGRTLIDSSHSGQAIDAYAGFVHGLETDPKGHTILIFVCDQGSLQLLQYLVYTEPIAELPMFDGLRNVPTIESSLGLTDYSTLADNIANLQHGHGDRASCSTVTFRLDQDFLHYAFDVFFQESSPVSNYIQGTMEFHALPRTLSPADNIFGLDTITGPLISFLLIFSSKDECHDAEVIAIQKRIIGRVRVEAEKRNLYHPFLFPNYSGQWQDVIGSFGEPNVKYLTEVAKIYDPEQAFQHLQSGAFKVSYSNRNLKL